MGFSSLFPVALFSVAVHGLMNPTPRATDKVVSLDNVQLPQPTVPPSIHELVRRQADGSSITVIVGTDNTCGYISGTKARPLICTATTRQCAFVPAQGIIPGFAGCCDNLDCEVALGCYDREAVSASECDGECMDNLYITKCTAYGRPYCVTVEWLGSVADFYCDSTSVSTIRTAETTYAGQSGGAGFQQVVVAAGSDSFPIITNGGSSQTNSPGSSSSNTANGGSGSSTPIGPIVGGVVGGVAAIGLVILGIVLLLRRKKRASAPSNPSGIPPVQQQQQPQYPPPNNGGAGGGYYNGAPNDPAMSGLQPVPQGYSTTPPLPNNQTGYSGQQQQQQYQPMSQPTQVFAYAPQHSPDGVSQNSSVPPPSTNSSAPGYQHMSQQSFPTSTTGSGYAQQPQQQYPGPGGVQGAPSYVYEAGGNSVGGPQDHHHGQMHQLP